MRPTPIAALALAVLAGPALADQAAAPPEDTCAAAAVLPLVGQPRAALDGLALPEAHRVYLEGSPVTTDYNPARLNVEYDQAGRITRVHCG